MGVPSRWPAVRRGAGAAGHAAAVVCDAARRLGAARPNAISRRALSRVVRPAGAAGFFRAGFFRRQRTREFSLAAAGVSCAAAVGAADTVAMADRVASRHLDVRGAGADRRPRLLRRGVVAGSARTQCGQQVVSLEFRRLGRAGARSRCDARADAGKHAPRRRQLQDRCRTRLRAERAGDSGARPSAQPASRPCAAAAAVGLAASRPQAVERYASAVGRRRHRCQLSRTTAALSRPVRDGRAAAAAESAQHRSRASALPAIRADAAALRGRLHSAGDGVDRYARSGRHRCAFFRAARLGVQGRCGACARRSAGRWTARNRCPLRHRTP